MILEIIALKFYSIFERIERKAQWNKYQKMRNNFKAIGTDSMFPFMDYDVLNPQYMEIGNGCSFGHRFRMCAYDNYGKQKFQPKIKIGNGVHICNDCHILGIDSIVIGNGVLMASSIFITDHFHGNITSSDLFTPHLSDLCQVILFA